MRSQLHPYRNGRGQKPSPVHQALILARLWDDMAAPLAIAAKSARKVAT